MGRNSYTPRKQRTSVVPCEMMTVERLGNAILMTYHYPDLGCSSDWLKQISLPARPIGNTTYILLVTRHQYGISLQSFIGRHFAGEPVLMTAFFLG